MTKGIKLFKSIFNHSNTNTTKEYTGLTEEKANYYYGEMAVFFEQHSTGETD